jgi:hypothetical protein
MEDEKVVDAPVRFFAIGYSDYEGYWETFVFATSAKDALERYTRNSKRGNGQFFARPPRKEKVDVLEAELNEFGVLESTDIAIRNAEIEC